MELAGVAGKCRACQEVTSEDSRISLYSERNLKDIFHDVTSIKIHKEDKLPEVLCSKCHSRLLEAHKFRQMCAMSALKFHTLLVQNRKTMPESQTKVKSSYSSKKKRQKKVKVKEEIKENKESISPHPTEYVSVKLLEGSPEEIGQLTPKLEQEENLEECASYDNFPITNQENQQQEPEVEAVKTNPDDLKPILASARANFSCCICKKSFPISSSLMTHLRRSHNIEKLSVCIICEKDFQLPSKLNEHLAEQHKVTLDNLGCNTCKKSYGNMITLLMHIKMMHSSAEPVKKPKNFICETCGKAFYGTCELTVHSYTHGVPKPFVCSFCPRRCESRNKLQRHMMRHEGIKNHVCTICGLRKTTISELKIHMNYHTREKLYTCEFCDKKFSARNNMTRHVKVVHLGTLSYPCTTCGKAFGKKETLKHHAMTHTGEKPEVCSVCGKRFIQKIALKKHMQTHVKYQK